jgi:U2 small nuclear ribonucleoprotein A'
MRITADLLLRTEIYLNPVQDRELSLRGLKIPAVENLAVLQDQLDTIDLSDNEIKRLDNFPLMPRLGTLLLNNNHVAKISSNLGNFIANLHSLVLTNNRITNLSDIDQIASLTKLEHISLMDNPVAHHPNYRVYIISCMPTLKSIDFMKVTATEKSEAAAWRKTEAGKAIIARVVDEKSRMGKDEHGSSTDRNGINNSSNSYSSSSSDSSAAGGGGGGVKAYLNSLTEAQRAEVKAAIEAASTKEAIERVEYLLKTGSFPFKDGNKDSMSSD